MLFNHQVHFVQKFRELLDFVDKDKGCFGGQCFPDQGRAAREAQKQGLIEQTVNRASSRLLSNQRGLASLAGPKRKQDLFATTLSICT